AGGTVRLVLVRADGSTEPRAVTDEDVGPGTPALLMDAEANGASRGWLSLDNDADAARLLALEADGRPLDELLVEPAIGTAAPLAAHAGQMLVAEPSGKSLALRVLVCEPRLVGSRGSTVQ